MATSASPEATPTNSLKVKKRTKSLKKKSSKVLEIPTDKPAKKEDTPNAEKAAKSPKPKSEKKKKRLKEPEDNNPPSTPSDTISNVDVKPTKSKSVKKRKKEPTVDKKGKEDKPEKQKRKKTPDDDDASPAKRQKTEGKPARALRKQSRRELLDAAKTVWEELRPRTTTDEKTRKLSAALHAHLQGHVQQLIFNHEASRMVQYLVTNGTPAMRAAIITELLAEVPPTEGVPSSRPFIVRMADDRYAHFLIPKLLKHAPSQSRSALETQLLSAAPELLRSAIGATSTNIAFLNASPRTRARVVIRILLARAVGIPTGEDALSCDLDEVFKQTASEFRDAVKETAFDNVRSVVEKGGSTLRLSVVHAVLRTWVDWATGPGVCEKEAARVRELAVSASGDVASLATSKDGALVAMVAVKALDAKHRKAVIRGLRGRVRRMVMEDGGHMVLLSVLEFVDDTRLVGRVIGQAVCYKGGEKEVILEDEEETAETTPKEIKQKRGGRSRAEKKREAAKEAGKEKDVEMEEEEDDDDASSTGIDLSFMTTMCESHFGRAILLCILAGRDTRYFNPQTYDKVWSVLDEGMFGQTSKKDADTRRRELRDGVETAVCELVRERQATLLTDIRAAPVVVTAAGHETLLEAVADGVAKWGGEEVMAKKVLGEKRGRRAFGALLKVGGKELAEMVVEKMSVAKVVRIAGLDETCKEMMGRLVSTSEREEAIKAVELVKM